MKTGYIFYIFDEEDEGDKIFSINGNMYAPLFIYTPNVYSDPPPPGMLRSSPIRSLARHLYRDRQQDTARQ